MSGRVIGVRHVLDEDIRDYPSTHTSSEKSAFDFDVLDYLAGGWMQRIEFHIRVRAINPRINNRNADALPRNRQSAITPGHRGIGLQPLQPNQRAP
jgi:hypothetical protein